MRPIKRKKYDKPEKLKMPFSSFSKGFKSITFSVFRYCSINNSQFIVKGVLQKQRMVTYKQQKKTKKNLHFLPCPL